jgi:hypothetical protein
MTPWCQKLKLMMLKLSLIQVLLTLVSRILVDGVSTMMMVAKVCITIAIATKLFPFIMKEIELMKLLLNK